ncbi:hypothetical protein M8494_11860 [Serratia ureilytica]
MRNRVSAKEWGAYPILTFPEVPEVDVVMMPRPRSAAGRRGVGVGAQRGGHRQRGIRRYRHSFSRAADHLGQTARGAERAGRRAADRPAQKKKRGKWWFGGAAGLFGAVLGIAGSALPWRAEIAPVAAGAGTGRRPRWSAAASWPAGDCAVCHTASEGATNAGGLAMATPFGTLYSTNIPRTWQPASATGRLPRSIGRCAGHRPRRLPSVSGISLHRFQQNDRRRHAGAVRLSDVATGGAPGNPANQMRFPFNLRPLMAGWNALFLRQEFQPDPQQSAQWNRGAYLVNGSRPPACHSPRNLLGAEKGGAALAGEWWTGGSAGAESIGQCGQAWTRNAVSVLPQRAFRRARRGGRADGAGGQRTGDVAAERSAGDGQLCDVAEHQGDAECGTAGAVGGPRLAGGGATGRRAVISGRLPACHSAAAGGRSCSASVPIWPITPISSAIAPIT